MTCVDELRTFMEMLLLRCLVVWQHRRGWVVYFTHWTHYLQLRSSWPCVCVCAPEISHLICLDYKDTVNKWFNNWFPTSIVSYSHYSHAPWICAHQSQSLQSAPPRPTSCVHTLTNKLLWVQIHARNTTNVSRNGTLAQNTGMWEMWKDNELKSESVDVPEDVGV